MSTFRTRLTDTRNGQKILAYGCGVDVECGGPGAYDARLIDVRNGQKIFAVTGETNILGDCCEYPLSITDPPTWITFPDIYTTSGVLKHVKVSEWIAVRCEALFKCAEWDCQQFLIKYDGTKWTGGILNGALTFTMWYDGTKPPDQVFQASTTGCFTSNSYVAPQCGFPFVGLYATEIRGCCSCISAGPVMQLRVVGFCDRNHVARLVDVIDGVKIFAVSPCCQDSCVKKAIDCCTQAIGCDIFITIMDSSGCGCFGTSYDLTYIGTDPDGIPTWSYNNGMTFPSCNVEWTIQAKCYTNADGSTYFQITIAGTNAFCTYSTTFNVPGTGSCFPINLTAGPVTITGTPRGPFDCCSPIVTVTLTQ